MKTNTFCAGDNLESYMYQLLCVCVCASKFGTPHLLFIIQYELLLQPAITNGPWGLSLRHAPFVDGTPKIHSPLPGVAAIFSPSGVFTQRLY